MENKCGIIKERVPPLEQITVYVSPPMVVLVARTIDTDFKTGVILAFFS